MYSKIVDIVKKALLIVKPCALRVVLAFLSLFLPISLCLLVQCLFSNAFHPSEALYNLVASSSMFFSSSVLLFTEAFSFFFFDQREFFKKYQYILGGALPLFAAGVFAIIASLTYLGEKMGELSLGLYFNHEVIQTLAAPIVVFAVIIAALVEIARQRGFSQGSR